MQFKNFLCSLYSIGDLFHSLFYSFFQIANTLKVEFEAYLMKPFTHVPNLKTKSAKYKD